MKLPRELQEKEKARRTQKEAHDTDIFFAHSACCNEHWKLMHDKELNSYLLQCRKCLKVGRILRKPVNEAEFLIEPCPCGCGNYALFSKCCNSYLELDYRFKVYWELIINKESKKTFLQCESCGQTNIEINCGKFENIKCEAESPIYVRGRDGVEIIDPDDIKTSRESAQEEQVIFKIDNSKPDTLDNLLKLPKRFYDELMSVKKTEPKKYEKMMQNLKETRDILLKGKVPSFWNEQAKRAFQKELGMEGEEGDNEGGS